MMPGFFPTGPVSVFDNRFLLNQPPRVTRWRIDEQAHTATLIQRITDPAVHRTVCCGSARLLPDGSWLVDWGDNGTIGGYRADGTPTFRLQFQRKNFQLSGGARPTRCSYLAGLPSGDERPV